jgi:hypothetical protein
MQVIGNQRYAPAPIHAAGKVVIVLEPDEATELADIMGMAGHAWWIAPFEDLSHDLREARSRAISEHGRQR